MIEPGVYRHYKGGLYEVIGMARHSESLEHMVVYKTLYENELAEMWVRPAAMFQESVKIGDKTVPRFEKL